MRVSVPLYWTRNSNQCCRIGCSGRKFPQLIEFLEANLDGPIPIMDHDELITQSSPTPVSSRCINAGKVRGR
jgi:hypothetical protein